MNHLTVDEIIEFVSARRMDDETLALMMKVNSHIRTCDRCLKLVQKFQILHDEFTKISNLSCFEDYVFSVCETEDKQITSEADEDQPSLGK